MFCYIGLAIGDFGSGAMSQLIKSRNKVVRLFLVMTTIAIVLYFSVAHLSLTDVLHRVRDSRHCGGLLGRLCDDCVGAVRYEYPGDGATTAPNFVRGAVVILTSVFEALRPAMGIRASAMLVGTVALVIAFASLRGLEETYGKDLNYLELS